MVDNNTYIEFKRLTTITEAEQLIAHLTENGISAKVNNNALAVDEFIIGVNDIGDGVQVLVDQTQFDTALQIAESFFSEQYKMPDQEHYLHHFSDDELQEVLYKSDEWSDFDVITAQKLLAAKGITIPEQLRQKHQEQRLKELRKPQEFQYWVIAVYFCAVVLPIIGGGVGYLMLTSKKTLPNGERILMFSESVRVHAKIILIINLFSILFAFTILIMNAR